MIIGHTYYIVIVGQHTGKLRLRSIMCAADDTHNATTRDLHAHSLSGEHILQHTLAYRRLRPKHVVSVRLMTLAEDKSPEANLLIGMSQYALQRHTRLIIRGSHVIIYVGRVLVGRWLNRWHIAESVKTKARCSIMKSYKHILR